MTFLFLHPCILAGFSFLAPKSFEGGITLFEGYLIAENKSDAAQNPSLSGPIEGCIKRKVIEGKIWLHPRLPPKSFGFLDARGVLFFKRNLFQNYRSFDAA
jgi:hypothetical protein